VQPAVAFTVIVTIDPACAGFGVTVRPVISAAVSVVRRARVTNARTTRAMLLSLLICVLLI
jgi:hypothetical protein